MTVTARADGAGSRTRPGSRRRPGLPAALIAGSAALGCLVLALVTMGTGPLPVSPLDVLRSAVGGGPVDDFVILEIGLPRVLVGMLAGMAMGVGGALLQAHSRNPLGTPDIIGFSAGAALGAVIAIVPLHLPGPAVSAAAVIGGLIAAVVVFGLAGGAHRAGYRLIVVGIAVGALLYGVTAYLVSRARITDARTAQHWLTGSLNGATWRDVQLLLVVIVVVLPAALAVRRYLRITDLGEVTAVGLGVRPGRVGAAVVAICVVAVAAVVVTVGPIGFVDLAAPQLALRLTRRPAPLIVTSALLGGFCLMASDLLAQRAIPGIDVPVGIATGVVGGLYFAFLLLRLWRRR